MPTKLEVVQSLIPKHDKCREIGEAFAPSNIALAKYWGKRDTELNLPQNSSLSISLNNKGAHAKIFNAKESEIIINQHAIDLASSPARQILNYLQLFPAKAYRLELEVNIPFAAGLASSAAVFAAIALALNDLHSWKLNVKSLSILARLGSGSAARSIEHGFVLWHKGQEPDGSDSFAEKLDIIWPELRIGLCLITEESKKISSRVGMEQSVKTSPLYSAWPNYAENVATQLQQSLATKDFSTLGSTAEHCAQTMHALMLSAWPSLDYSLPETLQLKQKVCALREQEIEIYFTQDAGPNLKLLFLAQQTAQIQQHFPQLLIINPFEVNHVG